jgi:Flp pilus assembly protein TadD
MEKFIFQPRRIYLKTLAILICLTLVIVSCAPNRFKSEFDFANKLAQQGLWEEAFFRWKKSMSLGNETAALHNNLAIYYERKGEIQSAEAEYQKALKLDPENAQISSNYKKFKQQHSEKKKNEN